MQCTEYKPVARDTDMITIEIPARLASVLLSPLNTIYPESQNMGSPTTKPVMLMPHTVRFSPSFFRM
ncbi:hypothetical protein D3C87_2065400 [compost metagenome]